MASSLRKVNMRCSSTAMPTKFGGFGNIDDKQAHFTLHDPLYAEEHKGWLQMLSPCTYRIRISQEITDRHPYI